MKYLEYRKRVGSKALVFVVVGALFYWLVLHQLDDEEHGTHFTIHAMNQIRSELQRYHDACGKYPIALNQLLTQSQECSAFIPKETSIPTKDWWKNEFTYDPIEGSFTLRSYGNSWLETNDKEQPKLIDHKR